MMNFNICTPTKVVFGRDIEAGIGEELKARGATCVLLHFGGGSVKKSGLYDKVVASLEAAGLRYVPLGGVAANPKLSMVHHGVEVCRENGVDFLLAVGGGSVIDSTKAIGVTLANDHDYWHYVATGTVPTKCMPVATVLTLSAAGSEMSSSSVISHDETQSKRGLTAECVRPVVSFMNPENTYTVSPFQTSCGTVDILMHTLERYLTAETDTPLTDRMSEALMISVRDAGVLALADPCDYVARATLMWAGSLSHNDLTGCGRKRLFPVHKMEHDVSGVCDTIAHGAGLSVLFPAWAMHVYKHDVRRFAQLANRVFGVTMNFDHPEETALRGIQVMKTYFKEIGMPVTWDELGLCAADREKAIQKTVALFPAGKLASFIPLTEEDIRAIYKLAE